MPSPNLWTCGSFPRGYSAEFVRATIWVNTAGLESLFEEGNHDGVAGFCENAAFYTRLEFELDDDENIVGVTYEADKPSNELDEYLGCDRTAHTQGLLYRAAG